MPAHSQVFREDFSSNACRKPRAPRPALNFAGLWPVAVRGLPNLDVEMCKASSSCDFLSMRAVSHGSCLSAAVAVALGVRVEAVAGQPRASCGAVRGGNVGAV